MVHIDLSTDAVYILNRDRKVKGGKAETYSDIILRWSKDKRGGKTV